MAWSEADIPDQRGQVVVVTGATSGIGFEAARALAEKSAKVILCGRSAANGEQALQAIRRIKPDADVRFEQLDLADLASARAFAQRMAHSIRKIDILINNAGLALVQKRHTTRDGFELQLGTNYLGHYALTAALLPLLLNSARARVVSVSSLGHRGGRLDFDDLQAQRNYDPGRAYGDSKLAMILFARELQRMSEARGWPLVSNAAHPGWARTNLKNNGPRIGAGRWPNLHELSMTLLNPILGQPASEGALPLLYAAVAPEAKGGGYYGPDRWGGLKGSPTNATMSPLAQDDAIAQKLWSVSMHLTGTLWPNAPRRDNVITGTALPAVSSR